jgi:tetratricopeptide repeat protein 21B
MDENEYKSIIFIAGLDRFFNTMNSMSVEAISKFGNSSFRFLNGCSLILSNRIQEGIRELTSLTNDSEVGVGSMLALMFAHKKCNVVDKDAVGSLEFRIKEERKRLSPNAAYYASLFLFFCGKYEKARDYADKTIKLHRDHCESLKLRAWCDLMMNQSNKITLELFNRSVTISETIDGVLGQVRYHQSNNDFEKAISILNRLSVRYPKINVALVEKMKTYLASWEYEQAYETSYRILSNEPMNIEALRVKGIITLCRDGKIDETIEILRTLYKALDTFESSNSEIYYEVSQLFAKCSGRNQKILEETYRFAERSNALVPSNSKYLTELGFQSIQMKQVKNAIKFFKNATKIDDNSLIGLCGLTLCELLENGNSTQVGQQIEFLNEIQGEEKSPLLLFLTAKVFHDKPKEAIKNLVEACEIHFKNLKTLSFGSEYLRLFDPDFLLQLCNELLRYCPIQQSLTMNSSIIRENLHISLKNSLNILEAVVKALPGSCEALFNLARVQFLSNEVSSSAMSLQKILQEIDPTFTPAHLLIAQIHIQQKNFQNASQSLEVCLSHDFKIRENPLYHLINGIVLKHRQSYEDALKSFKLGLSNCGYKNFTGSETSSPSKTDKQVDKNALGLADLVTLFLETINTLILINENSEALKTMQFAMKEFEKTPEVGRLIIANSDLYLSQGNTVRALDLLSSIQPGQSYYLQARTKMANIYLVHKKDRLSFAQCFKELVLSNPGPDSYIMLGDAYMSIQEPDDAVEAYRQAVMQNPSDPSLASKLGRAYIKTHQYKKAIAYYKDAIRSPENYQLKLDLAELYLKLKQYTNADQILVEEIKEKHQRYDEDMTMLQTRTKLLLLLARVRERSGNISSSLTTLKEARDNQIRIHQRLNIDQNSNSREQSKILSKICALLAEQSILIRDNEQAIQHYKESIKYSPQDIVLQASLAKLFMQLNRMKECQNICAMILDFDPTNESAQIMMADLSFRRMDFDNAAYHFSQLILTKPTYWTALARLIEVMRRSGILNESLTFLEQAEEATSNSNEPGLCYCKGLYDWYTCNPNSALRHFNESRRDQEWGQQSVFNMIEICLNPDNDLPGEGEISEVPDDIDVSTSRTFALKTAERLLKELKPKTNILDNEALNHKLLENFLLLATRQRSNIEKALNNFTAIASQEEFKENIGAIYGISAAHVMLKQSQRAKNQLKRINKNEWTFEEAEYLERCWLLLADIYIQAGKSEIAADLLTRVLKHNKSCYKAYELCGQISEKEQNFKAASIHYSDAWKYSGQQKPSIAHKLAYSNMKSRRYADAIDVCQQVLKTFPDYSSVRDILEKSRNNLKT